MAARNTPQYHLAAADVDRDRENVLGVWRRGGFVDNEEFNVRRYNWFHRDNPQGSSQLNCLFAGDRDEPIGFLGIAPRSMRVGEQSVRAGVLVDFIVDPAYRTALPALTLQKQARARALESMQVVYGMPNDSSAAICLRAGHQLRFNVPEYVRVLRARRYLERHFRPIVAAPLAFLADRVRMLGMRMRLSTSPYVGEWGTDFGSDFDDLWSACANSATCIGVRDRKFLQWRFGAQPGRQYRIFAVRDKGSRQLRAYFVCEMTDRWLSIKDCLWRDSEAELEHGLLLLSRAAYAEGAEAVRIQLSARSSAQQRLRRAGFVRRAERLFFAVVDESLQERIADCCWHITQADEDI